MGNKNGISKNIDKMKQDIEALKNMPDGKPIDWLKQPWNVHHWVDIWVESCRAAPYLMGKIYSVYIPASVVAIIVLAVKAS